MATNYGSMPELLTNAAQFKKKGGRPAGSIGKRSVEAKAIADGMGACPITFLASVMKNRRQPMPVRVDAAKGLLPYLFPRLATIFVAGQVETNINIAAQIQRLSTDDPRIAEMMETLSLALSDAQRAALRLPAPDEPRVIDITPHPAP